MPTKLYPAPKMLASVDTKPQGRISYSSKAGKLYVNDTIIEELSVANMKSLFLNSLKNWLETDSGS
jgi:hypothetical protein